MRKGLVCLIAGLAVLLVPLPPGLAQDHGGGGGGGHGGGGGCGDVFGDLIHVLRADTGQPILAQRWIEMPKELPGYDWGYCPIAVDELGNELGFAPLSCDVAEADLERVVEVDYFGRLNGGRTKERNNRMHFNEVISSIKDAERVTEDPAGRLMLGYDCTYDDEGKLIGCEWATVDSPMESLGLYTRLMKYGHFQTDPFEEDPWAMGDPARPTQYHPALGPDDYAKFDKAVRHLLAGYDSSWMSDQQFDPWYCFDDVNENALWDPPEPYADAEPFNGSYDEGELFTDINGNGVWDEGADTFHLDCAVPDEGLQSRDFIRAGAFLGGAANKTGKITVDLVQYLNRILKIAKPTEHTVAAPEILSALVRTCPALGELPVPDEGDVVEDPTYDMESCITVPADSTLENYADFPDVQEKFVDFARAAYLRGDWRSDELLVPVVRPDTTTAGQWVEDQALLAGWLAFINGPAGGGETEDIDAFVEGASDALRSIEFIHNYAVPEDLGYFPILPTTSTTDDPRVKVE